MAVTNKEVRLRLVLDSKLAEEQLKKVKENAEGVGNAKPPIDGLAKSLLNLGAGVVVVNQALELARAAFTMLAAPIQAVTREYIEQEKAETRLANALKIVGQYSEETMVSFNEFADELEMASTVSGPLALDLLSTAKAMGLTNQQATILAQTAADLGEATGVDAKTAFDQLRGTLGGVARELGKYFPEIKALTEEQLKAGQAVDILREKFAGMAQAGTASLAGSLLQLTNAFNKLLEEMGRFLVDFLNIPGLVKIATVAFNTLAETLKAINDFIKSLGFVGDILKMATAIGLLGAAYAGLNAILAASTTLQTGLTTAFISVGSAVGAQTVAVTTLSAAFMNLQRVAIASASAALRGLIVVLAQAARGVITLTTSILFNPLFLKAALLAVGLVAFAKAIKEVFQEITFLSEGVRNFGAIFSKTLGEMTESLNFFANLREAALVTFNVIKEVAKILLVGFLGAIVLAVRGVVGLMQAFAMLRGETGKYNDTVLKLEAAMVELGASIDKSLVKLSDPVKNLSSQLDDAESSANKVGAAFAGVNRQLRNTFDFDMNNLRDRIFGDEFIQAALDYKKSLLDLQITRQNLLRDEKQAAELVERYREAALEHNKARFVAEKLVADTISGLRQTQLEQNKEMLRDQEKHVKLAQLEAKERTAALEQTIRKVTGLASVIGIPVGGFNELRQSVALYNTEQMRLAQNKELQKKLEADKKAAEELAEEFDKARTAVDKMLADTKDLKSQLENIGIDSRAAIELERINNVLKALENQDILIKANLDPEAARALTDNMIKVANKISAEKVELLFFTNLEETGLITGFAGKLAYETALAVNEQMKHFAQDKFWGEIFKDLGIEVKGLDKESLQGFVLATAQFTSTLIDGIMFAAVAFVALLSGGFIDSATDIVEAIGEIPNKFLASLNKLDTVLQNFVKNFINATIKLVQALPRLITESIIPAFKGFVTALAAAMPHIIKALADAAPAVLAALLEGIATLAAKLPDALMPLIMKLPEILAAVLSKLPEIILKSMLAMGKIMSMLILQIPQLVVEFFEYLPDIIDAMVEGLVASMGDVALAIIDAFIFRGGIEKIVGAFLRAIPKIVWAVINGIAKGLKRIGGGMSNIWKGGTKIIEGLEGIADKAVAAIDQIARKVSKETSQVFQVKDLEEAAGGGGISEQIGKAFQVGIDAIVYHTKGLFQKLKEFWDKFYNGVLALFDFIWTMFLKPFLDALLFIWNTIYELIIKPFIDALLAAFEWFNEHVMTPLRELLDNLAAIIGDIWVRLTQAIKDIITALGDFAKTVGKNLSDALKTAVEGLKSTFTKIGTWIADGLRTALNGLGDFLTDIFKQIDPGALFENMFRVDYQGQGTVEKTLGIDMPFMNFAAGGMVPGNAMVGGDSFLNDRILALLSPGEAIIPRSAMDQPGIAALVNAILRGDLQVPQFALGGAIGQAVSAVSDAGQSALAALGIDLESAWNIVRTELFGMVMRMFEANAFSEGGLVTGSGFGDTVPAMLTPGEFVVRRQAVKGNFDSLNQINSVGSASGSGGMSINKIEINAKTNLDADSIRREVIPAIEKHLKRASLDGKPLIAASGVFTR